MNAFLILFANDVVLPSNSNAPIKLTRWHNMLLEIQPDSNTTLQENPLKAVQTTLTFEAPFESMPRAIEIEGQRAFVLKNASMDSKKTMDFKEASLNSLEVFSYQNDLYLLSKKAQTNLEIRVSRSKDKKTLRFVFLPKGFHLTSTNDLSESQHANIETQNAKNHTENPLNALELKSPLDLSHAYKVLGVIAVLLLILYIVKKKFAPKQRAFSKKGFKLDINILSHIDTHYKIISIETQKERYLVLLNDKHSLLLEKVSLKASKEDLIKEAENNIKNSKLGNLYARNF
ncbi:hypothetical protein HCD_01340 [Helicobacter cetorum MIT 99-5656]|uniref:Uncharacterized protein n=2 Tax=Helicobacter cetorum TaxID=138563 RepID=I0EQT1_HELCM|nr:hypothetical protein HCD_01340 [Helicobacter cetorum MIT 99-5656]